MKRYLSDIIKEDIQRKMVFVAGPRQVGKTTLAKSLVLELKGYLNWDIPEHREAILTNQLPDVKMWVFDELHKYKSWRGFLKGLFDLHGKNKKILVTGSAKLDIYRYGGDSLQGRYHFFRLYPLSVAELKITTQSELEDLLKLSGFPEPFFNGRSEFAKRWSLEYRSRILQEEISSIEILKDLGKMELMLIRLPDLVGSPLSLNSLREDLEISYDTAKRWIEMFERFYAIFRIAPFGSPKIRAVKKTPKHYHFDWSLVKIRGAKIENFFAVHLAKWAAFERDAKGRDIEIRYFRDLEAREVDFVVLEDNKPVEFIEVKSEQENISTSLKYLKNKFPEVAAYQVHFAGDKDYISKENIRVLPMIKFLQDLV